MDLVKTSSGAKKKKRMELIYFRLIFNEKPDPEDKVIITFLLLKLQHPLSVIPY